MDSKGLEFFASLTNGMFILEAQKEYDNSVNPDEIWLIKKYGVEKYQKEIHEVTSSNGDRYFVFWDTDNHDIPKEKCPRIPSSRVWNFERFLKEFFERKCTEASQEIEKAINLNMNNPSVLLTYLVNTRNSINTVYDYIISHRYINGYPVITESLVKIRKKIEEGIKLQHSAYKVQRTLEPAIKVLNSNDPNVILRIENMVDQLISDNFISKSDRARMIQLFKGNKPTIKINWLGDSIYSLRGLIHILEERKSYVKVKYKEKWDYITESFLHKESPIEKKSFLGGHLAKDSIQSQLKSAVKCLEDSEDKIP